MRYNDLTRRYFETAPSAGGFEGPDVRSGEAGSRAAGTWVRFDVRIGGAPAGATVLAARFRAFGCPHVIAVAAWLAERAAGLAAEVRLPESIETLRARFEIPVEKTGRLLIVEDAWNAAMSGAWRPPSSPGTGR